jgi:glucose-1-phosphate adenylyltransferase
MINTFDKQVLAATQTPGEAGMKWFQGTADAVRQFTWVFEVNMKTY